MKKIVKNFPWLPFLVSVVLFGMSLIFKAYDMAAVSCIGIIGSLIVFSYNCRLNKE